MATIANLQMDQGADFTTTINLDNVDGTNFDLTGYTVKSQLAKTYASTTKTTISASITNASGGEITLTMSNSATSALAAGRYVYDVEITQTSGGAKTRVIEGQITVHPQVTST
tara:strand:+ start:876 stop:1214 length:339 start_codon:yes stop_codon:yes gene_type:complete